LLAYSKERKPEPENCFPNEIVEEVCALMDGRAREHDIRIVRKPDPRIGEAFMDPKAIHRSLLNLVSNAIDACIFDPTAKKRWLVAVKTAVENDHLIRFEVADNGIGMDHETKKNLFSSPFSTKGEKGTGLGLLVTEKIVKENGGDIEVESQSGKGTSFTIFLPYREAQKGANTGGRDRF